MLNSYLCLSKHLTGKSRRAPTSRDAVWLQQCRALQSSLHTGGCQITKRDHGLCVDLGCDVCVPGHHKISLDWLSSELLKDGFLKEIPVGLSCSSPQSFLLLKCGKLLPTSLCISRDGRGMLVIRASITPLSQPQIGSILQLPWKEPPFLPFWCPH